MSGGAFYRSVLAALRARCPLHEPGPRRCARCAPPVLIIPRSASLRSRIAAAFGLGTAPETCARAVSSAEVN